MTKLPDIIKFAAKNDLSLLNDFVNLPRWNGSEACRTYAMKHENHGVWGPLRR